MTPAQLALLVRTQGAIGRLRPDMAVALVRAWATITASFNESELMALIEHGYTERLIAEALSEQMLDRALIPMRERMRDVVRSGFTYTIPQLPRGGKIDGTIGVMFDHLTPDVQSAIRTLESPILSRLKQEVRDVVRERVRLGLVAGEAPRTIARDFRNIIGLGPTQYQEVRNYRDALMGLNGRSITDYKLSDATARRLLAKGELTPAQVERYTEAYRKRRIALNAETTAKSAAQQAFRVGQRISWQSAQEAGMVPDGYVLMKQWVHFDQQPDPRLEHIAMGKLPPVPFDSPYTNGDMVAGESDPWNCKCLDRTFVARAA